MKNRNIAQNKFINRIIPIINRILEFANFDSTVKIESRYTKEQVIPYDIDKEFLEIYEKSKDFTMTTIERMFSLYKAVDYIIKNEIPGDIVECGVWKGGSMMLCALAFMKMNDTRRKIYLYDTYQGMTEPTHHDIGAKNNIEAKYKYNLLKKENKKWAYAPLKEVKYNLYSTGYPKNNLIFIKGKVEATIPSVMPDTISILRLDTDWFDSTYHELIYLYPKLSLNGILILDDYGHWKGAKKATDKYFQENNINILLNRIDNTGRLAIKLKK